MTLCLLAANACVVPYFQADGSDDSTGGMGGDDGTTTGGGNSGDDSGGNGSGGADGDGGDDNSGGSGGSSGGTDGSGGETTGSGGDDNSGGSGGSSGGADGSGGDGSGGDGSGGDGSGGGGPIALELTVVGVAALDNDDCDTAEPSTCPVYPEESTSFGANTSPAMQWTQGPAETLSYAVTLVDLSNAIVHWALWDIPPDVLALPANLPGGATLTSPVDTEQAGLVGGTEIYFGPGACEHVYELRLYALNTDDLGPLDPGNPSSAVDALEELTPVSVTFVRMETRDYCP